MANGPTSVSPGDAPVYDISHIKEASYELLGRNVRIETKGDKQVIQIDTAVGKFFRKWVFDTKYSDLVEVRKILDSIEGPSTNPENVISQKPMSDKDLQVINSVRESITKKEDKLLNKLIKNPVINDINNLLSNSEGPAKDKLRLLKDHGVDLKHKTINVPTLLDKLLEDIATPPVLDVLGNPITTDLRTEISDKLYERNGEKRTQLTLNQDDYQSVQKNNKQKKDLASLRTLEGSELEEAFKNVDPKVQLKFMLELSREKKNLPTIDKLFVPMDKEAKYSFISGWLAKGDENKLNALKDACPGIKKYIDNEFPEETRRKDRRQFELILLQVDLIKRKRQAGERRKGGMYG